MTHLQKQEIRDNLKAAKWLLENVGWCKHTSVLVNARNEICAYCAVGAIDAVTNIVDFKPTLNVLVKVLIPEVYSVPFFNDRRSTRKADVIKAFDKAIRSVR